LGWLNFNATVSEAENVLNTKYYVYEHKETGQPHIACDQYSVPTALQDTIDFITPTLHFDMKLEPRNVNELSARDTKSISKNIRPGNPNSGNMPKMILMNFKNVIKELKDCDKQVRENEQ
jgi:tripeptidyl-peptidase-1